MRKEDHNLGIVYAAYFGGMTLLMWSWNLGTIWWLVGGLLGVGFVMVDRFIYVLLTKPHEHLSEHVRHLLNEKRFLDAIKLLRARGDEQRELTVKSVFFMAAWIPAALFVMTSTASMLAMGFVMGIGLHLLYDVWKDRNNIEKLKEWLFWPVKREVSDKEVKVVVGLFGVFFGILSIGLVI